ncbi:MAG: hypothetical protein IPJ47_11800 [Anaerolineales bacterium]|nr:hypothetical protein [Anaerolineales bacterium]
MIAGDIKYNLVIASIALMVSFSLVLLGYINYFQSYGLSFKRGVVALGFTIVSATLVLSILKFLIAKQFSNDLTRALKSLGFSLFISVLFSPCFAPIPHYPASPLFQPVSRIKITLKPEENKGTLQLKGVWLRFNEETFSNKEFVFSSEWASDADKYFLSASTQGELYWEGRIGEHATLTIFPPDGQANVTVLWDDEETSSVLADAPFVVKEKCHTNLVLHTYYSAVYWLFGVCAFCFLQPVSMDGGFKIKAAGCCSGLVPADRLHGIYTV